MFVYLIFLSFYLLQVFEGFLNEPDVPTKEYEQEPVVVKDDG